MTIQVADSSDAGRVTLAETVAAFTNDELLARTYRKVTVQHYSLALQQFQESIPHVRYIDQLDVSAAQMYQTALEQRGLGVASQHVKLSAVRTFIVYLEQQGLLLVPFSREIRVPSQNRGVRPPITDGEWQALVGVATHPRDIAILKVLYCTGIRLGQLRTLTLDDIALKPRRDLLEIMSASGPKQTSSLRADATSRAAQSVSWIGHEASSPHDVAGHLFIHKGRTGVRKFPLDLDTCLALATYLRIRPASDHVEVFLGHYGRPLSPEAIQKMVGKCARWAGIGSASPESFRVALAARR